MILHLAQVQKGDEEPIIQARAEQPLSLSNSNADIACIYVYV
jgi:hypothetical protein